MTEIKTAPLKHPQVETGLGFTCDEQILPIIKAIWAARFKTIGSCQDTQDNGAGDVTVPSRFISVTHGSLHTLLDLAIFLNKRIATDGFQKYLSLTQRMVFQGGRDIWLSLSFTSDTDNAVLGAFAEWKKEREEGKKLYALERLQDAYVNALLCNIDEITLKQGLSDALKQHEKMLEWEKHPTRDWGWTV